MRLSSFWVWRNGSLTKSKVSVDTNPGWKWKEYEIDSSIMNEVLFWKNWKSSRSWFHCAWRWWTFYQSLRMMRKRAFEFEKSPLRTWAFFIPSCRSFWSFRFTSARSLMYNYGKCEIWKRFWDDFCLFFAVEVGNSKIWTINKSNVFECCWYSLKWDELGCCLRRMVLISFLHCAGVK